MNANPSARPLICRILNIPARDAFAAQTHTDMSDMPLPPRNRHNMSQEVSLTIEDNSTSITRARRRRVLTEEVKAELREIFDLYMDLDTYRVTVSQLEEMMRMYGYYPKKELFHQLLSMCGIRRHDERVTYDKFENIIGKLITRRNAAAGIMKAFQCFDLHKDGCVTFTSLCEVSRMMNAGFSDDDILEMIVEADIDRDGVVDIHDFAAMMKLTDIEW